MHERSQKGKHRFDCVMQRQLDGHQCSLFVLSIQVRLKYIVEIVRIYAIEKEVSTCSKVRFPEAIRRVVYAKY